MGVERKHAKDKMLKPTKNVQKLEADEEHKLSTPSSPPSKAASPKIASTSGNLSGVATSLSSSPNLVSHSENLSGVSTTPNKSTASLSTSPLSSSKSSQSPNSPSSVVKPKNTLLSWLKRS